MVSGTRTKRNRISSSYLFLMELIIALLLFAIASAACVTVFVRSHRMSRQASLLNLATDRISSAAELIRGSDSISEIIRSVSAVWPSAEYPGQDLTPAEDGDIYFEPFEMTAVIHFDADGQTTSKENAAFTLTVEAGRTDSVIDAALDCTDSSGDSVCSLAVTHYVMPEDIA